MGLGFEKLMFCIKISEHIMHKPTSCSVFMKKGRLECVHMIYIHEREVITYWRGGNQFVSKEKENLKLQAFDNSIVFLYTYGIDA